MLFMHPQNQAEKQMPFEPAIRISYFFFFIIFFFIILGAQPQISFFAECIFSFFLETAVLLQSEYSQIAQRFSQ